MENKNIRSLDFNDGTCLTITYVWQCNKREKYFLIRSFSVHVILRKQNVFPFYDLFARRITKSDNYVSKELLYSFYILK